MASIHKLTTKQCDHTTKSMNDGGGLWLIVTGSSRKWVFRKTIAGKVAAVGLGGYPDTSLKEARDSAKQCRDWVKAGLHPKRERQRLKREREAETPTFVQAAARFILINRHQWSNRKHTLQWIGTLRQYAKPVIGSMPVDEITIHDVQAVLSPIWHSIPETAKRVQGRIERVLDYATVNGFRQGENPARWKGNLDAIYPASSKVKRNQNGGAERHHKAMPYSEVPAFWLELQGREGVSAKALQFMILTACRTGEVLGACWEEINLEERVWILPARRMKMKKEHRVPLTGAMVEILESLPRLNEYVFAGLRVGRPLSSMALLSVMRKMGYVKDGKRPAYVPHGFRSSFRDWCEEQSSFPHGVIERALAHTIKSATERAYNRGDLLEKRRKLMEAWGVYVLPDIAGNVAQLSNAS